MLLLCRHLNLKINPSLISLKDHERKIFWSVNNKRRLPKNVSTHQKYKSVKNKAFMVGFHKTRPIGHWFGGLGLWPGEIMAVSLRIDGRCKSLWNVLGPSCHWLSRYSHWQPESRDLTVTGSPKPIFHKIDLQYLEAFGEPKHTLRLTDAGERGCQACDTSPLLVSLSHLWPLIGWWDDGHWSQWWGRINIIIGGQPCQGVRGCQHQHLASHQVTNQRPRCGLTDQSEASNTHLMMGRGGRLW